MSEHEETGAFSVSKFCKLYSVGKTYCYGELKAGRLAARKAGNRTLILRAEAERWARALPKHQISTGQQDD